MHFTVFHSSNVRRSRGFTLLELITSIALLVIMIGLMVSLARYVRTSSADGITRTLLTDLEVALAQYRSLHGTPSAPPIPADVDEKQLSILMRQANIANTAALRGVYRTGVAAGRPLPAGLGGSDVVRDAWGQPIGYLLNQHPFIGMAPQNQPFYLSAGPDGRYLTREDNLYSYEQPRPLSDSAVPPPLDMTNNNSSSPSTKRDGE